MQVKSRLGMQNDLETWKTTGEIYLSDIHRLHYMYIPGSILGLGAGVWWRYLQYYAYQRRIKIK